MSNKYNFTKEQAKVLSKSFNEMFLTKKKKELNNDKNSNRKTSK